MSTAIITGNVVHLTVTAGNINLVLDMSLQRHHYNHCGSGAAVAVNSLFYYSVADETVLEEAVEVGDMIETLIAKPKFRWDSLFGKDLKVASGRVYLIDNSALNPNGTPNHFFIKSGDSVWSAMSQDEFVAASAIRRTDQAIAARKARGDKINYRDAKALNALRNSPGGANNQVIVAYVAAHTAMGQVPNADQMLVAVSGQPDIVARARALF
jgi:hypothetical protein